MKAVRVTPLMKKAQAVRRKRRRKNKRIQMRRTPVQQVCSLTQFYLAGFYHQGTVTKVSITNTQSRFASFVFYGDLGPSASSGTTDSVLLSLEFCKQCMRRG